jgi:hypothetical protein
MFPQLLNMRIAIAVVANRQGSVNKEMSPQENQLLTGREALVTVAVSQGVPISP